jgi:hypothetical protein
MVALKLTRETGKTIEQRLARAIVAAQDAGWSTWQIDDLEATGPAGDALSSEVESRKTVAVDSPEFLHICREPGQVIELRAQSCSHHGLCHLVLRDGASLEMIGPDSLNTLNGLGSYVSLDPALFDLPA